MKTFIFIFVIFCSGWWSCYLWNYLYEKRKKKQLDCSIRKEIADNHDYYYFAEDNKDIALGLEYALEIFDDHYGNTNICDTCNRRICSTRNALKTVDKCVNYEQQYAEWIFLDDCDNSGYYCSKCNKRLIKEGWSETVKKIKFCPNCGLPMKGVKHG